MQFAPKLCARVLQLGVATTRCKSLVGLAAARHAALLACAFLAVAWPAHAGGASQASCDRAVPLRVAIDVGHSPDQYGATSARGGREYDFNLRFAQELASRGQGAAGLELFLLDPQAHRTALAERPAHAVEAKADVFVSIHHDYVNDRYLESWVHEGRQLKFSDAFRGHSLFVSKANGQATTSVRLATSLGESLAGAGFKPTLHHAEKIPGEGRDLLDRRLGIYEAPFAVLRLTAMPAVLLEVGVLAHRDEELQLQDAGYRARFQDAVIAGLGAYCRDADDSAKSR